LLVRHEGVTLFAGCEFRLLHHFRVVLHAFAAGVSVGKLEGVDSANPLEKPNVFISLMPKGSTRFITTHRPPKLTGQVQPSGPSNHTTCKNYNKYNFSYKYNLWNSIENLHLKAIFNHKPR
jgi:hypothetical protein